MHVPVVWNDTLQLNVHAHCLREQLHIDDTSWWRHQALSCDWQTYGRIGSSVRHVLVYELASTSGRGYIAFTMSVGVDSDPHRLLVTVPRAG